MPAFPSAAAIAAPVHTQHRFQGQVIYRHVPAGSAGSLPPALWRATTHPWRWNGAFPTLYTALSLDVSFAERLKRSGPAPVRVVVGVADATIARTIDLTDPAILALLGVGTPDLTRAEYTLTRTLGIAFYHAGITALLVPAAIEIAARQYPRFRVVRGGVPELRATPASGTNAVIFPSNRRRGDRWPERRDERFECEIAGIPLPEPTG